MQKQCTSDADNDMLPVLFFVPALPTPTQGPSPAETQSMLSCLSACLQTHTRLLRTHTWLLHLNQSHHKAGCRILLGMVPGASADTQCECWHTMHVLAHNASAGTQAPCRHLPCSTHSSSSSNTAPQPDLLSLRRQACVAHHHRRCCSSRQGTR